jgi:hypothetical protein
LRPQQRDNLGAKLIDQGHHRFGDAVLEQEVVGYGKDDIDNRVADSCDIEAFTHHRPQWRVRNAQAI